MEWETSKKLQKKFWNKYSFNKMITSNVQDGINKIKKEILCARTNYQI